MKYTVFFLGHHIVFSLDYCTVFSHCVHSDTVTRAWFGPKERDVLQAKTVTWASSNFEVTLGVMTPGIYYWRLDMFFLLSRCGDFLTNGVVRRVVRTTGLKNWRKH
jgi:hypothetical protein